MLLYLRFPVSILSFPFCTFHLTWDVVILFWEFRPWTHRKGKWTDFWKLMVPWIFRADSGCLREPWLLTLVAVVMFLPCSVHWSSWIISLYKTAVLQGQQLFCIMSIYIAIIEFKRRYDSIFLRPTPFPFVVSVGNELLSSSEFEVTKINWMKSCYTPLTLCFLSYEKESVTSSALN